MKIAVLYSSYEGSQELTKDADPISDPSRYLPDHECRLFPITKQRAVAQVIDIHRQGFDVVINLCDGSWHGDTAGVEVVHTLERLNMAFTGASSCVYDPSREAMKMAFHSVGVGFPAYVMARSGHDVQNALSRLRFPMLVKHPQGYSSVGLTRDSRVTDELSLRAQVEKTISAYGAALIEEFIEGREFTTLVTDPRHAEEDAWVLEPLEFVFPENETFKHFDLKWTDYERMDTRRVDDPALAARLREASALAFQALAGSAYLRCDIRLGQDGELYLLETNPNCGVFYPEGQFGGADLILAEEPGGHRAFLLHQIAGALRRQARQERVWERQYTRTSGFGVYARRPIAAGEVIQRNEERETALVSRGHAAKHWRGFRREWFDRYAWPLSENLHVMWSDDPDSWQPINHSCDPNAWLEGLDLVARRAIPAGEELTIDYATFCGPGMQPFECSCGAAKCRHAVTGLDHLLPEIRDVYRGHVSDYVQSQWLKHPTAPTMHLVAKRNRFGVGVRTERSWSPGEVICEFGWGDVSAEPTVYTIQFDDDLHAEPHPPLLRYINHSCAPNVHFDTERMVVHAVRRIDAGDELSFFYPSTEWKMRNPFHCQCEADACLGLISGAHALSKEQLSRYALTGVVARRALVEA